MMKERVFQLKINQFLILIMLLSAFTNLAYSERDPLIIDVKLNQDVLYPGDETTGTITIYNNGTQSYEYYIDIYALGYESWYSWNSTPQTIAPLQTNTHTLYIKIPEKTKEGTYYVYIKAIDANTHKPITIKKIAIVINLAPIVELKDIYLRYPEIEANRTNEAYIELKNIGKIPATNHKLIIEIPSLGVYAEAKIPKLLPKENYVYAYKFFIPINIEPGNYEIKATLIDDRDKIRGIKTTTFKVKPTPIIEEKIEESSNIFRSTLSITVENKGNAPGTYTYVLPSTGMLWIYDFKGIEPIKENNKYILKCNLQPNQSCSFTITINYWLLYVLLLAIITLMVLIFIRFTSPKIEKYHYIKGRHYHITIKITNHKTKELKDVRVIDHIKGIFEIDEKSIIPQPSKIRKTKDGYVLQWNLGNLKPGETRIINYIAIPKINVEGEIKIDEHAILEGSDTKNKTHKAKTKSKRAHENI